MLAQIVLPTGTSRITIRNIPTLFADAIHPAVPDGTPRQVTELKKFPLTKSNTENWCGLGSMPFPVSFTDDDEAWLRDGAWAKLPPVQLPMCEQDWEPYRAAFEANPPNGWRLEVTWRRPEIYQMVMHHETEKQYLENVKNAAMRGELHPRHAATLAPMPDATGELLLNCFVTLENFTSYANSLSVGVTMAPSQSAPAENGKKWTREKLKDLAEYRATHTMPETAVKFDISEQRIRQLLPTNKSKAGLFDGLNSQKKKR